MQNQRNEIQKTQRRKLTLPAKQSLESQIKTRWPELLTRPMKIGISENIAKVLNVPECDVSDYLSKAVQCVEYQKTLATESERFSLEGNCVGWVSVRQRELAAKSLSNNSC